MYIDVIELLGGNPAVRRHTKRQPQTKLNIRPILLFLFALMFVMFFFRYKSLFIFLILAVVAAFVNYLVHISRIHIHLGHISFLTVIFSYSMGLRYGLLMIVIGHIIPEILSGRVDIEMIISAIAYVIVAVAASIFTSTPILILGLILTVIQVVFTVTFDLLSGAPPVELLTEDGLEFVMNVVYYLSFSDLIIFLVK